MDVHQQPSDRIIRETECRQITGLCRMHRYNLEKQGKFPCRRQLGGQLCGLVTF